MVKSSALHRFIEVQNGTLYSLYWPLVKGSALSMVIEWHMQLVVGAPLVNIIHMNKYNRVAFGTQPQCDPYSVNKCIFSLPLINNSISDRQTELPPIPPPPSSKCMTFSLRVYFGERRNTEWWLLCMTTSSLFDCLLFAGYSFVSSFQMCFTLIVVDKQTKLHKACILFWGECT